MKITPGDLELKNLRSLLTLAREEDLGGGDITGELLSPDTTVCGRFTAREAMVVCGAAFLETIADTYDAGIKTTVLTEEGEKIDAGGVFATWDGPARGILAAERVALNFLQRLSAVSTITREYVDMVASTGSEIFDTRKTTPAWRYLEKYAVRCGGGKNHRMGLYDAILVKDNHLAALARGSDEPLSVISAGLKDARKRLGESGFVEMEVDTLDQLETALTLPVDTVLLDNMSIQQLERAVTIRDEAGLRNRVALEASGGITLANVRQVATAGVERISIGALTHSCVAVDIALDMDFV